MFVFLDDWAGAMLRAGSDRVRAEVSDPGAITWEPVGRLDEYLSANLNPRTLSYLDAEARARSEGTRFGSDWVIGAGFLRAGSFTPPRERQVDDGGGVRRHQ